MDGVEGRFDEAAAHAHFAQWCFNHAWTLIEKPERSAADDEAMILLSQASLWHWTERADCTAKNLSIGYWQASRIRSLVGHPAEAMRCARLSLEHSAALPPFYLAYAHEAVARAALAAGDRTTADLYIAKAREFVATIADARNRDLVVADLATLEVT
jgi:hypothetical protein